jgi:hypothetical protein
MDSTKYEFCLYPASRPDEPIDSVKVGRSSHQLHPLLAEVALELKHGNIDVTEISHFIAKLLPACVHNAKFREIFRLWERHGFHATPVHFYQPIPNTQSLPETIWNRPSELVGTDVNDAMQLDLLRTHFPKFRAEYDQFPTEPTSETTSFPS